MGWTPDMGLTFSTLRASDLLDIRKQPSQRTVLGIDATVTEEQAEQIAAQAVAWACRRDGVLIACMGIVETIPDCQGTAWAVLGEGIGDSHLELTRFLRGLGEASRLPRLEAMCRAADIESTLSANPGLDSGQVVALAMMRPTPECRWAQLVGLKPVHLLRRYGPTGEPVMLCERILPVEQPALEEAA